MRSQTQLARALARQGAVPSQICTLLQVRAALRGCRSVLDIGCGPDSPLKHLEVERSVGFEGYGPSVEKARHNRTHKEVVQGRVENLEQHFRPGEFDGCIALDVIEHLAKSEGMAMLRSMERIARKRVVVLTPNGFLPQGHTENADLQEHLSGWEPAEMRQQGFRVWGVMGPKWLRGEYHKLLREPPWFWGMVSLIGHGLYTRWVPSKAAAILCVKEK